MISDNAVLPNQSGETPKGLGRRVAALAHLAIVLCGILPRAWSQDLSVESLEQLLNTPVSTVSRIPEKRSRVPAAVHVITQEDIRRSGVTSIPEALRLAPGIHVARVDSNKWSIGIRGFGSRLARSMLVLIDGRAVYSPLFAGTYWEVQDTLLEDVDHIEVNRGPGGILWGSNAVNGIVNIITKEAKNTQGTLVVLGGGSEEQGFAGFRYGGTDGEDFHYRMYGKFHTRDAAFHPDNRNFDDWRMGQGGFRGDWVLSGNKTLSLQGDIYNGNSGQRTSLTTYEPPFVQRMEDNADLSGGNILGRWGAPLGDRADVKLQFYYDRTNRKEPTFQENRDTVDLDFQYHFFLSPGQEVAWGLGYRASSGNTTSVPTLQFTPNRRTDNLFSGYFQDEITLVGDRAYLIVGSKLEHNGYSGFEAQPNARLLWTPSPNHTLLLSAARAVRTPSRVETDMELSSFFTMVSPETPAFLRLLPNREFRSEKLHAYEMGYRVRPASRLFVTLSTFFNDYDDLISSEVTDPFLEATPEPAHIVLPLSWRNSLQGHSHGAELVSDWRPTDWWRLNGSYSYVRINLRRDSNSRDFSTEGSIEGSSPRHQANLQSSLNLADNWELNWMLRFVSELRSQKVPAYTTSDLQVGWRPRSNLELSLVGQNLHDPHHPEYSGGVEVERSVHGKVTLRW